MPHVWLIRAAPKNSLARAFVDNGVVALGWPGKIGDLTGLSIGEIALQLDGQVSNPASDAAELVRFRDEVAIGDIVVTPDTPVREFMVGAIAGAYRYEPDPPTVDATGPFRHLRDVDWWGRDDRDRLAADQADDLKWRRTIRALDGDVWGPTAEALRAAPRRAIDRGRSPSPRGPLATVLTLGPMCPNCFSRRPASWFVPVSDWCRDCRAQLE